MLLRCVPSCAKVQIGRKINKFFRFMQKISSKIVKNRHFSRAHAIILGNIKNFSYLCKPNFAQKRLMYVEKQRANRGKKFIYCKYIIYVNQLILLKTTIVDIDIMIMLETYRLVNMD